MITLTGKTLPWAIFFATLLVYLLFPTKNYYWDGMSFALTIENAASLNPSLLHPNHLIYNVFGWLVYNAAHGIGMDVRALSILQASNSMFSALSAVVLFHILNKFLRSLYLAGVLTFLFAFSATWWKFSTDANAYIPSVLFLLICFYLIIRNGGPSTLVFAGLSHATAMCFHQLAIFFIPVAVVGIILQRQELSRLATYAAAIFIVTFAAFYLGFTFQNPGTHDPGNFVRWLTSYSPEVGFVFNLPDNLMVTIRGHFRLMFGGRFNFLGEVLGVFTLALTGILIATIIGLVVQIFRARDKTVTTEPNSVVDRRNVVIVCLVWIAFYLGFLFFWIPQNTFYRLFYLPPMLVILGVLLQHYRKPGVRRSRAALSVVSVALFNFLFLIYPYAQVRPNTPLSLALEMNSHWSQRTTVYYSHENSDQDLLAYFNPSVVWRKIESIDFAGLGSELEEVQRRGGTAWLETTANNKILLTEGGPEWLARHSEQGFQVALTDPAYNMRLVQIYP